MQAIEIGILIINLISLSICGGLVFSLLTSTNRDESSRLFAAVCGTFAFWISLSMVRQLSLSLGVQDVSFVQLNLNLMMSAVFVSGAVYFTFIVRYTAMRNKIIDVLRVVIVAVTVVAIALVWIGNLFVVQPQVIYKYAISGLGLLLVGVVLGFMLLSSWLMFNGTTERSAMLFRPTVIMFIVFILFSFEMWTTSLGIHSVLLAIAASWIGLRMLRRQVVNPQAALNRDLQLTNQELQRTIHDLAQEKEKTEALNIELIQANRYKDEFLATMSHELRTPLNSIVGYSELLMTQMYGDLGQKQMDRLERIYRNGRHLTNVINAILDLNKIDSGRMQLEVEDFNLIDLIHEIETEFVPKLESSVEFSVIVPEPNDIPIYRGDKRRIAQVLEIIIDNAFKYTAEGHVKIKLNYTVVVQGKSESFALPTLGWLKDGHWVVMELIDTGTGIAPEDQARIFDRFSQVDASRTREYDGIGLGLTIARKLVELHDGLIWVKSYVGQGSTFYVALPFQKVAISQ